MQYSLNHKLDYFFILSIEIDYSVFLAFFIALSDHARFLKVFILAFFAERALS